MPELRVDFELAAPGRPVVGAALVVPPGVTILFGPSGAGKSTTLAVIAGLLRPTRGRISLDGEPWFDSARGLQRAPHLRRLAYVFQSLALFPHLSALENVAYGVDRALPRSERRRRAGEMLERMRVGHVADQRPRTLSGGEAQRVALARAFAREPQLLLLDEAFSALDRELRALLLSDLRRLVLERGLPVLHVTHHPSEARAIGDRCAIMRQGRVVAAGSVGEHFPPRRPGLRPEAEAPLDALGHTPLPILA